MAISKDSKILASDIDQKLSTFFYKKRIDFTVAVSAETDTLTVIDYSSFDVDTTKILGWQVTWSNNVTDIPEYVVEYTDTTTYLHSIKHRWPSAQNVRFKIVLTLKS